MSRLLACLTFLFALFATVVSANTEKVIFITPLPAKTPAASSLIQQLSGSTLTPSNTSVRTSLPVTFPSEDRSYGLEHWYLLRNLRSKQRYEVRICWAATQPTDFSLEVFELDEILRDPKLLLSVGEFGAGDQGTASAASIDNQPGSILGLRIRATADFFTTNQTLMHDPPPVDVDIILDPYLANIFPASLLPTAVYILVLAVVGWYVSGAVWSFLQNTVHTDKSHVD